MRNPIGAEITAIDMNSVTICGKMVFRQANADSTHWITFWEAVKYGLWNRTIGWQIGEELIEPVDYDRLSIAGQQVRRPKYISGYDWIDFWRLARGIGRNSHRPGHKANGAEEMQRYGKI